MQLGYDNSIPKRITKVNWQNNQKCIIESIDKPKKKGA